jgi:predicted flap endonuclease-1-like 5' DNA nuclease
MLATMSMTMTVPSSPNSDATMNTVRRSPRLSPLPLKFDQQQSHLLSPNPTTDDMSYLTLSPNPRRSPRLSPSPSPQRTLPTDSYLTTPTKKSVRRSLQMDTARSDDEAELISIHTTPQKKIRFSDEVVTEVQNVIRPIPSPSKSPSKSTDKMDIHWAVDAEHDGKSLRELITLKPSALNGLSERADLILGGLAVRSIQDLAQWRFYRTACAIVTMTLKPNLNRGGRKRKSAREHQHNIANIERILTKEYSDKSLVEIANAPLTAFKGIADWAKAPLAELGLHTINDLANWKFASWAEAMVTLSKWENDVEETTTNENGFNPSSTAITA